MQNVVLATVELTLDNTGLSLRTSPETTLPLIQAFSWSKINFGESSHIPRARLSVSLSVALFSFSYVLYLKRYNADPVHKVNKVIDCLEWIKRLYFIFNK